MTVGVYVEDTRTPRDLSNQDPYYRYNSVKLDTPVPFYSSADTVLPRSLATQGHLYQYNGDVWRDLAIHYTTSLAFSAFELSTSLVQTGTAYGGNLGELTYKDTYTHPGFPHQSSEAIRDKVVPLKV